MVRLLGKKDIGWSTWLLYYRASKSICRARWLSNVCYKYSTILMCFMIIVPLLGHSDEEFFLRGNKYYGQKDYSTALQNYMLINKKGRAVLYNIGNCLFHQEDYPQALVYWSRAEKGATTHEYDLIVRNKDYALKKMNKQKEQEWQQKIIRLLRLKIPYVSLLFLQLLFLGCWWLLFLRMPRRQKGLKKIAQSLLFFSMIVFAVILAERYGQQKACAAIVVKKEAKLCAGPDKSFPILSELTYADGAQVKEVREGWYKIQYADMIGWVEEDVIQII